MPGNMSSQVTDLAKDGDLIPASAGYNHDQATALSVPQQPSLSSYIWPLTLAALGTSLFVVASSEGI
jgi:hypothetical protein